MDKETRFFNIELRSNGDKTPKIEGYAAVYNQLSEDLGGFRELISPGFFDTALDGDCVALWQHNNNLPLGRQSNGTLKLTSDSVGLKVAITPPDTSWGRDAVESIKRGDVYQMSFQFSVKDKGDSWKQENGTNIRTLMPGGCEKLFDVSPVTFPAYPQTSVNARSKRRKTLASYKIELLRLELESLI